MKVLEKAEKGQGLALKLFNSGRVKYQQHVKHTHAGIGILPFINSQISDYLSSKIVRPNLKVSPNLKVRLDL